MGLVSKEELAAIQADMGLIKQFVPKMMLKTMVENLSGEEAPYFAERLLFIAKTVKEMPMVNVSGDEGRDPTQRPTAYLRYFVGDFEWYISEKDCEEEQLQAFGLADMGDPELGYIAISELVDHPQIELDLFFDPTDLEEVMGLSRRKYHF